MYIFLSDNCNCVGLKQIKLKVTEIEGILVSYGRMKCLTILDSIPVEIQNNNLFIHLLACDLTKIFVRKCSLDIRLVSSAHICICFSF
jgi:hypothetical protein